jgi:hypothetical protein
MPRRTNPSPRSNKDRHGRRRKRKAKRKNKGRREPRSLSWRALVVLAAFGFAATVVALYVFTPTWTGR